MDKSTTLLEQDLYFDDNITLERLSHPVSGKEFLRKIMYPQTWFWVPRMISQILAVLRTEPKDVFAKQTRRFATTMIIFIILVVWAIIHNWGTINETAEALLDGNLNPIQIFGGGLVAIFILVNTAFKNLRAVFPVFPDSKNITLDEYDNHNIDLLIQPSSPKWLNDALYDDAWPVFNGRRNGAANAVKFQRKIQMSPENLRSDQSKLSYQIDEWAEEFLKQFVAGHLFTGLEMNHPTKVQRALLVLWVINPPKETAISGTNHQRFSDYAHRVFAENVVNILSNLTPEMMKVKKISPNTMEQCLSLYEITSGTLDAQFTQMLIDDLFKQVSGMEPALQKILRRLIT